MDNVYVCPNCRAIGKSPKSSCPKCGGGRILEIPFDGKWVMVTDYELKNKLQEAYERTYGNVNEL